MLQLRSFLGPHGIIRLPFNQFEAARVRGVPVRRNGYEIGQRNRLIETLREVAVLFEWYACPFPAREIVQQLALDLRRKLVEAHDFRVNPPVKLPKDFSFLDPSVV